MLSLIGSLLGFMTSFLPKLLGFFEDKRDQAHELAMMDKQLEHYMQIGAQKMQMAHVEADIKQTQTLHQSYASITRKASQWCINLSSSVRPIITYCLFAEFVILTLSVTFGWIDIVQYKTIWNNEFQAVWAAVVSFWFGSRSFNQK